MMFRDIVRQYIGPPVNIEAIIRGLGLQLDKKADLDSEISGQLERLGPDSYRISANKADNYFRQRFTMAHELGHYMLHAHLIGEGVNDSTAYRSVAAGNFFNQNISPVEETEANRFAAEMLMPKELLGHDQVAGTTVQYLATRFQVSVRAMEIRLTGLGHVLRDGKVQIKP